jgi:transcription initiation factor TFIID subunit 2
VLGQRIPHIFINSSSYDTARHWVPCLDNLWDRCPWELEISVPRYLKQESDEVDPELGVESGQTEEGELVRVIASAELEEQVRLIPD